jgi:hypothetical protein
MEMETDYPAPQQFRIWNLKRGLLRIGGGTPTMKYG